MTAELKASTGRRELSAGRSGEDRPQPPVNILLVDDEPKNLTALESVLAGDDRRLVCAGSGLEALKHVLTMDFAVILLDVHMPTMDGFETAGLIRSRERSHETPIIFLTAAISGEVSIARGYALGAVDYLIKPFAPEILKSKVAVFVDLFRKTEQVKDQAGALAETTAFLNSVLEGVTGYAIAALDLDGTILGWNEGARRMFGYSDGEVIGRMSFRMLYRPEEGDGQVDTLLTAALRDGQTVSELECLTRAGQHFNGVATVEQRTGADGRLAGFVAIVQDVTAVKEAERQQVRLTQEHAARTEAERARDRLQQVIDVLPEGILIAEVDGRISMCNAAALAIIGEAPPPHDLWGSLTLDRYRLDRTPCPVEELPLLRAVQRGETVRGEQLFFKAKKSDVLVPVLQNSAPLRDRSGEIVGGVMAFQDISPIKEFERQKDAFLAAASHDLKNPLAVVKAQAQLLMRRATRVQGPETAALVDGLSGIDHAAKRLTGMVNELLDVARLEMGRPIEIDPTPTDVAELAHQVAAGLRPSSELHDIRVESATVTLVGAWDRQRLERVLVNLVTNAIKYSPEGGDVAIRVGQETRDGSPWATISVQDHGIGIPADELPRVFERFFRASNIADRIEGAGIGLSGTRQIVEQHGGSITAESVEGKGSTFTVWLPLEPRRVAS